MNTEINIQQAAERWGCSVRSVQMLCKQGDIPGARKVSGIWLLPAASVHPRSRKAEKGPAFQPEQLYGRDTAVRNLQNEAEKPEEGGCAIAEYPVFPGISLVFQEIHEEKLDYTSDPPRLPQTLIAIQHCREGRFEGEYPDGEYIYMGPGSLSVNLPAWAPASNSFPLKHYLGFYIAVLPELAEDSIQKLEQILGPLHIDFRSITGQLSGKNRLAIYESDEKMTLLLSAMYLSGKERAEPCLKLQVLELLQMLSRRKITPPGPERYFTTEQVQMVKEIRQYLISHLDQHITLNQLAGTFRMSLTAMKSCFRGVYGQSIGRYLREYRMQAGAEMLLSRDTRIIEIAASLGYENASKFSEAFAAFYGMTPSNYRKSFCPAGSLKNLEE